MEKFKPIQLTKRCGNLILFVFLCLNSCKDNEELPTSREGNFVSINSAEHLVGSLELTVRDSDNGNANSKTGSDSELKRAESIIPIPDEEGNYVYYIINYEGGGFIILSADNQIQPVLAFSLRSNFPMGLDKYPNGLVGWLYSEKEEISELRNSNQRQTKKMAIAWRKSSIQRFISGSSGEFKDAPDPDEPIDPDDPNCQDVHTTVGPLLQTAWAQGVGYNDLVPHTGCSNYSNGRAPTGCVATAMGQVMRYHQFPPAYNWGLMPNSVGSNETAQLMVDIGSAVNMDWDCNGSGADTENEVASSFQSDFGYSTAAYADFDHASVEQQLKWNRPVILKGGRNTGWWIFGVYSDGHAWVCDGYRSTQWCASQTSSLYLHMNWGWNSYLDGWYAFNNWNPGSNTFNYQRGMVYNIAP